MGDEFYMDLALARAWEHQLLTFPNPAVGCVLVGRNGEILAVEAHQKAGRGHAELRAVCAALGRSEESFLSASEAWAWAVSVAGGGKFGGEKNLDSAFCALNGATAYVTLEPCSHEGKTPPCCELLARVGVRRVVVGAGEKGACEGGGAAWLRESGVRVDFGVRREECEALLEPFEAWRAGNFSFLKLAMSANGSVVGGTISNLASRTHAHRLRELVELLVIGGGTVVADDPLLDARLAGGFCGGGRAPDVLVWSRRGGEAFAGKRLFGVRGREVSVSSELFGAWRRRLVMFEGGEGLVRALGECGVLGRGGGFGDVGEGGGFVRWLLIYRSNKFVNRVNLRANLEYDVLWQARVDDGEMVWARLRSEN